MKHSISIHGVYNTTEIQGVPQTIHNEAGLLAWLTGWLERQGFGQVSYSDGSIRYATLPKETHKPMHGFWIHAKGGKVNYFPLAEAS